MKTKNILKVSLILGALCFTANAQRTEQFTWGATGKFLFQPGTNFDNPQTIAFGNDFEISKRCGVLLKSVRPRTNVASGWKARTPQDYNGGFMSILTSTTGFDNK